MFKLVLEVFLSMVDNKIRRNAKFWKTILTHRYTLYVPLGISLQTPYNTSGKLLLRYIYYQFLNIFKRIFSLFGVIEKEKQHQKEMYFLREAFFPKNSTYLESLL